MRGVITCAAALLLALASPPAGAERLQVYAASSLTDALDEIARAFERSHPGITVELTYGGSQALRLQIENGAPADLFATADPAQTDSLERKRLAPAAIVFAHNRLVLVTPAKRARVKELSDLTLSAIKIVLAGPGVPAGRYAEEALERMEAARGKEFARRVRDNVVSRETNVRAVLAKVVLGEADGGIVYRTDAASADGKVVAIEIPEAGRIVAEYRIGVTARAESSPAARAFLDAVAGPAGQETLRRHGFEP